VLVGFSTAVALGVAVLVIILLGHQRTGTQASSPPSAQTAGPTSLAALRSELALLRRPQRATDMLTRSGIAAEQRQNCSNCLNVASVLPHETRLLTTIRLAHHYGEGARERVYLVLGTVPSSWQHGLASGWRQPGRAAHGLHLSIVGIAAHKPHQTQPLDELLNYAQLPMPAQALTPRDVMITNFETVGVLPDGVTHVKWELANPGQKHPKTVYPHVHGNVATAPWTPAPRSTALINEQLLVGATWYSADGRIIASFTDNLAEINKAYSPPSQP
jgi:hypothetical protein